MVTPDGAKKLASCFLTESECPFLVGEFIEPAELLPGSSPAQSYPAQSKLISHIASHARQARGFS